MEATLKIYNSIQDKEPSKVYTCYRTTMAINNKLDEFVEEITRLNNQVNEKSALITDETSIEEAERIKKEVRPLEEKASQLTFDSIRLFFPEFTEEEFLKLDLYDYQTFCLQIGAMRGKIYNRAQKN